MKFHSENRKNDSGLSIETSGNVVSVVMTVRGEELGYITTKEELIRLRAELNKLFIDASDQQRIQSITRNNGR